MTPVVAVDGPSGVGKGTLTRWLATALGDWHVLDSGALYRLTALAALRTGIDAGSTLELQCLAASLDVQFCRDPSMSQILLNGQPVGAELYSENTGRAASVVAAVPQVRAALLDRQRAFRRPPGLVADGRDMGTVVFPDAPVKIFLIASPEERAKRRYKQLKEKGIGASLSALARDIADRDARDADRAVAPLKPASDAVVLDTSGLSIDSVRQSALALINENLL